MIPFDPKMLGDLYEQRMLVFLETEPQSNRYRQVILDSEQYKKITAEISTPTGEPDVDGVFPCIIKESNDTYVLPDLTHIHNEDK